MVETWSPVQDISRVAPCNINTKFQNITNPGDNYIFDSPIDVYYTVLQIPLIRLEMSQYTSDFSSDNYLKHNS